jgi:uncharacterized protein YybS (DUF2232 family)
MKALDQFRSPRPAIDRPLRQIAGAGVVIAVLSLVCLATTFAPVSASAAVVSTPTPASVPQAATSEKPGSSLEAAAAKAGNTGRTIAMSLIGLALAVAAIVLAFRRDFKEAAGVFVVGIVAVLLATPTGVTLLQDTVSSLFGSH